MLKRIAEALRRRLNHRRSAVGYAIVVYFLGSFVFSIIWAVIDYEVYPVLVAFKVEFFNSGVFQADVYTFMTQLILWFPVAVLWSLTLNLWNKAQRKYGPEDLTG